MTGEQFGRLTVLACCDERSSNGSVLWRCVCECGNLTEVATWSLRSGNTRSCGCLAYGRGFKRGHQHRRSHGLRKHPLYYTWRGMRRRCYDRGNPDWASYGGRGITVCARWNDFTSFLADVGEKPGPGYTLDRIDNDGNYEPSNVRWATPKEQAANRRKAA